MITLGEWQLDSDRYQWILTRVSSEGNLTGSPSFHGDLRQATKYLIEQCCKEADSLAEILDLLHGINVRLEAIEANL